MKLFITGKASSKRLLTLDLREIINQDLSLMKLLESYNITIASSCNGAGKCKKCVVNTKVLSCQISAIDFYNNFGNEVVIHYL